MSATIIPFRPADDGTVLSAARNLVDAGDRFERRRVEISREADEWEAKRRAAQANYFARQDAERARLGIHDGPEAA